MAAVSATVANSAARVARWTACTVSAGMGRPSSPGMSKHEHASEATSMRQPMLAPTLTVVETHWSVVMPNATIQRHSRLRKAIIDRQVQLPPGSVVGYDKDEDRRRHTVSEGGVVVVTPGEDVYVDPAFAGQEKP